MYIGSSFDESEIVYVFIYKQDSYQMLPNRSGRNRLIESKSKVFSKSEVGVRMNKADHQTQL